MTIGMRLQTLKLLSARGCLVPHETEMIEIPDQLHHSSVIILSLSLFSRTGVRVSEHPVSAAIFTGLVFVCVSAVVTQFVTLGDEVCLQAVHLSVSRFLFFAVIACSSSPGANTQLKLG